MDSKCSALIQRSSAGSWPIVRTTYLCLMPEPILVGIHLFQPKGFLSGLQVLSTDPGKAHWRLWPTLRIEYVRLNLYWSGFTRPQPRGD